MGDVCSTPGEGTHALPSGIFRPQMNQQEEEGSPMDSDVGRSVFLDGHDARWDDGRLALERVRRMQNHFGAQQLFEFVFSSLGKE